MGAVIILVIGGLLSAVLIVPRQREMRRHTALVSSLAVGDPVMTGSGLYGTITVLEDDLVWLEVAPGTVVKMARRAIAAKVDPAAGDIAQPRSSTATPSSPASTAVVRAPSDPVDHDADGLSS
jgi:preprotein translocase subunit YajC